MLGIAESLREAFNYKRPPALQVDHDKCVAVARDGLGESAFVTAHAAGRLVGLDQAIEYALSWPEAVRPKSRESAEVAAGKRVGRLAPRERQVALLIAEGKTNREIAANLSITEGTAETHVQHILNKLGVNTRAQIAAWVVASGLRSPSPITH
jgi:non-specific serine/threonine protein kinase